MCYQHSTGFFIPRDFLRVWCYKTATFIKYKITFREGRPILIKNPVCYHGSSLSSMYCAIYHREREREKNHTRCFVQTIHFFILTNWTLSHYLVLTEVLTNTTAFYSPYYFSHQLYCLLLTLIF